MSLNSSDFITREEYNKDMEELKKSLTANTIMTAETNVTVGKIGQDTADIVAVFKNITGGLHVLGALGKIAVWVTKIAAAGAIVYAIIKFVIHIAINGKFPTP